MVEVKIRYIEQATGEAATFCFLDTASEEEVNELIRFIERSGGVYCPEFGDFEPFHAYQLVFDEGEAYIEFVVGREAE